MNFGCMAIVSSLGIKSIKCKIQTVGPAVPSGPLNLKRRKIMQNKIGLFAKLQLDHSFNMWCLRKEVKKSSPFETEIFKFVQIMF